MGNLCFVTFPLVFDNLRKNVVQLQAICVSMVVVVSGQVENAETETKVRKRKYGNGNMKVRRKATYQCFSALLTHEGVCVEAL